MQKGLTKIFQNISISYTIIMIVNALLLVINYGWQASFYASFLLQVFLLLCACWGVEILINKITVIQNLSNGGNIALSVFIEYIMFLVFVKLFCWFTLKVGIFLFYTAVFLIIEFLIRRSFHYKWKKEEEIMNRLIEQRNHIS